MVTSQVLLRSVFIRSFFYNFLSKPRRTGSGSATLLLSNKFRISYLYSILNALFCYIAAFLASAVCGCCLSCISLSCSLYYGLNRSYYQYYGNGTEPRIILTIWSLLATLLGRNITRKWVILWIIWLIDWPKSFSFLSFAEYRRNSSCWPLGLLQDLAWPLESSLLWAFSCSSSLGSHWSYFLI